MASSEALARLLEVLKHIRSVRTETVADISVRRERVHDTVSKLRSRYKLNPVEGDADDP